MLTTSFVPGSPNWLDVSTPDTAATAAFYSGLFGWDAVSLGPDAGGYGFFQLGGKTVAAYGPLPNADATPSWTAYYTTADVDLSAKAVEDAGGTVLAEPYDVDPAGRTGVFADPTGGRFMLWQAGEIKGLDAVNDAGSLRWLELHTDDPAAARAFYQSVFGWTFQDLPMGDHIYGVASFGGETDTFGGITPQPLGEGNAWHPYFEVTDADATVAKAVDLGATVVRPAESVPGIGRIASLQDPHGASFVVITSDG